MPDNNLNFSPNALQVLKRYLKKTKDGDIVETPVDLFKRVSKALSSVEKETVREYWEKEFYKILTSLDFIPSSPILKNSGTNNSLFACYFLNMEDNMQHIMRTITDAAMIIKSGGGVGINFSHLRPQGAFINSTHGKAMGPIAVMRFVNELGNMMTQSGFRKAAMMGLLNISHPDIFDFISCKKQEGTLTNFNISVAVTDEFMEALENDKDFPLTDPRDNKVVRVVKAKDLWDKIIESAWTNGEPGIVFIDTINKKDPLQKHSKIEGCNPCLSPDSLILTQKKGLVKIKDLDGKKEVILSGDGEWREASFFKTGVKELFEVKLTNGMKIQLTSDHLINVNNADLDLRVSDLKNGTKISLMRGSPTWIGSQTLNLNFAVILGFLFARAHIPKGMSSIIAHIDYTSESEILDLIRNFSLNHNYKYNYNMVTKNLILSKCPRLIDLLNTKHQSIPNFIYELDPESLCHWLKGVFSANAKIISSRIVLKFSISVIEHIQLLLLALGIKSYCTTNKKHKDIINLTISGPDNISIFINKIGFVQSKKNLHAQSLFTIPRKDPSVASVKFLKVSDVYDFTEPVTNHAWVSGLNVHNCSESPLLDRESCDLGSINLSNFVNLETKEIDKDRLKQVVKIAVRLLDNVIDASHYVIPDIEKNTKATRKIGLGIMGLADALAKMHIPYASELGIKVASEIMKLINDTAWSYSKELADEKGEFPLFNKSSFKKKVRNATVTSVAPTGSLAILANCSYGCEPIFKLAYKKNILDGNPIIEVSQSFKQIAQDYGFWNKAVEDYITKQGSCQGCPDIPKKWQRVFMVSNEIKPEWHLRMQAALQEHTSLAISKTVFLPNSATKQDISEIYMRAYNLECKGITVYREGSRENEVVSSLSKEDKYIKPRKRPEIAQGNTLEIHTGCGKMLVNLTADEKGYVDVVTQMGKSGGCSASFLETIGRLISIAFRSNIDPYEILSQIKGIRCPVPLIMRKDPILSCSDAVAKSLEKLIDIKIKLPKYNEKASTHGTGSKVVVGQCPECGSPLVYSEGCANCMNSCGYSKCG